MTDSRDLCEAADMTQARARELFSYDAASGGLFWRSRPLSDFSDTAKGRAWNTRYAGRAVGWLSKGAYCFRTDGVMYMVHRVVWLWWHGSWPEDQIDHIDGDPSNNRIENLRCVSDAENKKNMSLRADNWSGFPGIRFLPHREKWRAEIGNGGSNIFLGEFADLSHALIARSAAEKALGFHPNHGRRREP